MDPDTKVEKWAKIIFFVGDVFIFIFFTLFYLIAPPDATVPFIILFLTGVLYSLINVITDRTWLRFILCLAVSIGFFVYFMIEPRYTKFLETIVQIGMLLSFILAVYDLYKNRQSIA